MIQQMVQPCNDCNGEGKRVTQVCHECNAKKYKVQEKVLNAKILPGMSDGEKLRFPGECSDSAEYEQPGDVILNLMRTESLDYEWQGSDLHINHSVSLKESLLGFNVKLDSHPSGKELSLTWGGGTLKHDGVLVAKGLGMPVRGSSGDFGDLFIHIDVMGKISEWTAEQRELLQKVFPDWTTPEVGVPLSGV
jgi:DnaJ-class molecular chaperone